MKMLMCREATRLMSKRLDVPLGIQEKMTLKFHLAMCGACKQCNKQFQLMHDAGRVLEHQTTAMPFDVGGDSR
ncbi:zf-HC2 domain-containing protein [Modicisalibacter sp. 'Wilcox']|uniref:zf-HC2 domain-containing protein n=1 Tax=Modicisalibacter sp. 'Wilcox' TaxID=2679914 RepID=UPI001969AF16|nr:zf-HC2 domain-containing protein [Modicisalibacter sp. 'Wilcox']